MITSILHSGRGNPTWHVKMFCHLPSLQTETLLEPTCLSIFPSPPESKQKVEEGKECLWPYLQVCYCDEVNITLSRAQPFEGISGTSNDWPLGSCVRYSCRKRLTSIKGSSRRRGNRDRLNSGAVAMTSALPLYTWQHVCQAPFPRSTSWICWFSALAAFMNLMNRLSKLLGLWLFLIFSVAFTLLSDSNVLKIAILTPNSNSYGLVSADILDQ